MRIKILHAFWVRFLVSFLLTMQPKVIFGQRQFSQNFEVAKAWPNYCPNETDAIGTYHKKSRSICASECLTRQWCTYFSYNVKSGLCYLYSFVSTNISYNIDCKFMMVSLNKLNTFSTNGNFRNTSYLFDY